MMKKLHLFTQGDHKFSKRQKMSYKSIKLLNLLLFNLNVIKMFLVMLCKYNLNGFLFLSF